MTPKCKHCIDFEKVLNLESGLDGICRRLPPRPIAFTDTLGSRVESKWPEVFKDDWCREFEEAPPEPSP